MLSPVSTWMGDRLGTLGAVGIKLFFFLLLQNKRLSMKKTELFIYGSQNNDTSDLITFNLT